MIIIISVLFYTGCLPVLYYPTEVCKQDERYLGIGASIGNNTGNSDWGGENPAWFSGGAYSRYGFGNNFDFGVEMGTTYIMPSYILFSSRKQFNNIGNNKNSSLIADIGIGMSLFLPIYRLSLGLLIKPFSIVIGISEYCVSSFPGGSIESADVLWLRISIEDDGDRTIIPFIHLDYEIRHNGFDPKFDFSSFFTDYSADEINNITRYISIGFGVCINWKTR